MRVTLARWGNSAAVRLPKAVVEQLRLKPGQELELVVEGQEARLRAAPARDYLDELLQAADRIGWEHQPGLEDWSPVEAPWPKD